MTKIKINEAMLSTEPAINYSHCYVQCVDNMQLLKSQPNESVDLIYSDILYGTGRNFGEYQDLKPKRDVIESHYLTRLIEMKRVLKQNGSIYLQMDTRINHWMRILMDKVFGYDNFQNEIVWLYRSGGRAKKNFTKNHDIILFYTKSKEYVFNQQFDKSYLPKMKGRVKFEKELGGYYDNCDFCDSKNVAVRKVEAPDFVEVNMLSCRNSERTGYPTQKPKELIKRFVLASSNEGDVVADYYLGSGTTAEVCKDLNRNFIGCDISEKAIEITKQRLSD